MWQHMFCVSMMCSALRRELSSRLNAEHITETQNICCHITTLPFYKYFKHFK